MNEQEIKARAYEILFRKYREIHRNIVHSARQSKRGKELSEVQELLSDVVDLGKYVHRSFATEEDLAVISALEYCLGERDSLD